MRGSCISGKKGVCACAWNVKWNDRAVDDLGIFNCSPRGKKLELSGQAKKKNKTNRRKAVDTQETAVSTVLGGGKVTLRLCCLLFVVVPCWLKCSLRTFRVTNIRVVGGGSRVAITLALFRVPASPLNCQSTLTTGLLAKSSIRPVRSREVIGSMQSREMNFKSPKKILVPHVSVPNLLVHQKYITHP